MPCFSRYLRPADRTGGRRDARRRAAPLPQAAPRLPLRSLPLWHDIPGNGVGSLFRTGHGAAHHRTQKTPDPVSACRPTWFASAACCCVCCADGAPEPGLQRPQRASGALTFERDSIANSRSRAPSQHVARVRRGRIKIVIAADSRSTRTRRPRSSIRDGFSLAAVRSSR